MTDKTCVRSNLHQYVESISRENGIRVISETPNSTTAISLSNGVIVIPKPIYLSEKELYAADFDHFCSLTKSHQDGPKLLKRYFNDLTSSKTKLKSAKVDGDKTTIKNHYNGDTSIKGAKFNYTKANRFHANCGRLAGQRESILHFHLGETPEDNAAPKKQNEYIEINKEESPCFVSQIHEQNSQIKRFLFAPKKHYKSLQDLLDDGDEAYNFFQGINQKLEDHGLCPIGKNPMNDADRGYRITFDDFVEGRPFCVQVVGTSKGQQIPPASFSIFNEAIQDLNTKYDTLEKPKGGSAAGKRVGENLSSRAANSIRTDSKIQNPEKLEALRKKYEECFLKEPQFQKTTIINDSALINQKGLTLYTPNNSSSKGNHKFDFSANERLKDPQDIILQSLKKVIQDSKISPQLAAMVILIAIKNNGISNKEESLKEDLKSLGWEDKNIDSLANNAKAFSKAFQDKMREKGIFTGNQSAEQIVGMRLKRLTPYHALEIFNSDKKYSENDSNNKAFDTILKRLGGIEKIIEDSPNNSPTLKPPASPLSSDKTFNTSRFA